MRWRLSVCLSTVCRFAGCLKEGVRSGRDASEALGAQTAVATTRLPIPVSEHAAVVSQQ